MIKKNRFLKNIFFCLCVCVCACLAIAKLEDRDLTLLAALENTFPIWGTVVLLIITRVPQIGLNDTLQNTEPSAVLKLGTLGIHNTYSPSQIPYTTELYFKYIKIGYIYIWLKYICFMYIKGVLEISAPVFITFRNIFMTDNAPNFTFGFFFVPWLIPFIVVSSIALVYFRKRFDHGVTWRTPFTEGSNCLYIYIYIYIYLSLSLFLTVCVCVSVVCWFLQRKRVPLPLKIFFESHDFSVRHV